MLGRALLVLFSAAVYLVLVVGVIHGFFRLSPSRNACTMTYMSPNYVPIPVEHQEAFPDYTLFFYFEGNDNAGSERRSRLLGALDASRGDDGQKKRGKLIADNKVVLFVPGNAGSYSQGRSLGHELNELAPDSPLLFTLEFNREFSAASGLLVRNQALFANAALAAIRKLYADPDNLQVIWVGHSMGGLVVRALPLVSNYVPKSMPLQILLSSPVREPPLNIDPSLHELYDDIDDFWRGDTTEHTSVISLHGGHNDELVRPGLSELHPLDETSWALTMVTTSIPGIRRAADHRCILWCNEIVTKVAAFIRASFTANKAVGTAVSLQQQQQQLSTSRVALRALARDYFAPASRIHADPTVSVCDDVLMSAASLNVTQERDEAEGGGGDSSSSGKKSASAAAHALSFVVRKPLLPGRKIAAHFDLEEARRQNKTLFSMLVSSHLRCKLRGDNIHVIQLPEHSTTLIENKVLLRLHLQTFAQWKTLAAECRLPKKSTNDNRNGVDTIMVAELHECNSELSRVRSNYGFTGELELKLHRGHPFVASVVFEDFTEHRIARALSLDFDAKQEPQCLLFDPIVAYSGGGLGYETVVANLPVAATAADSERRTMPVVVHSSTEAAPLRVSVVVPPNCTVALTIEPDYRTTAGLLVREHGPGLYSRLIEVLIISFFFPELSLQRLFRLLVLVAGVLALDPGFVPSLLTHTTGLLVAFGVLFPVLGLAQLICAISVRFPLPRRYLRSAWWPSAVLSWIVVPAALLVFPAAIAVITALILAQRKYIVLEHRSKEFLLCTLGMIPLVAKSGIHLYLLSRGRVFDMLPFEIESLSWLLHAGTLGALVFRMRDGVFDNDGARVSALFIMAALTVFVGEVGGNNMYLAQLFAAIALVLAPRSLVPIPSQVKAK